MVLDEKAERIIGHVRQLLHALNYEHKHDIIMWEKQIDTSRPICKLLVGPIHEELVEFTLFHYVKRPFLLCVSFEDLPTKKSKPMDEGEMHSFHFTVERLGSLNISEGT